MRVSEKLAIQTFHRFQELNLSSPIANVGHAALTYTGDVYAGLQAREWTSTELLYSQSILRIISGLYGIVKPLDGIQPYRLEMGLSWKTPRGKNLTSFWSDLITSHLKQTLQNTEAECLLNLASEEYAQCIQPDKLGYPIVNISFFELKNGKKSFQSFHAKRARGLMASYIVRNQIKKPNDLFTFQEEGYLFDANASEKNHFIFVRNSLSGR